MALSFPYLFLLSIVSFSSWPPSSATHHTMSKGSSLNIQNKNDVLVSLNEVFSAGFYSVGDNAYCFAIWFTEPLSDGTLTVVWMANRDNPVNGKGSKLSLSESGHDLVLLYAGQLHAIIWEATTGLNVDILSLENNGNLVLVTLQGDILWQSFDSPTDTLLQHQVLTRGAVLISSKSRTNYSTGFYKFHFDEYNILRLSFVNLEVSSLYWPYAWEHPAPDTNRTMYNNSRIAVLDTFGHFMSSDNLHFTTSDFGLRIWRRMIVESDGNIRVYSLDTKRKVWEVTWQAISRPCRIHGVCGGNSLCVYTQNFGRKCTCIPGHKMKVQTDWSYGCEPDFRVTDDSSGSTLGFLKLSHSDFYGYDSGFFVNFTFDRCKEECLSHYNCKGFLYTANNYIGDNLCYTKSRLLNGQQTADFYSNVYVKLPSYVIRLYDRKINPLEGVPNLNCSGQNIIHLDKSYKKNYQDDSVMNMLWFTCALGGFETILIIFFLFVNMRVHRTNQVYHQVGTGFKRFNYDELKNATNNFSQEIGQGGSSIVYKGVLLDNRVAAIKRFKEENYKGEAEFLAEISILGRLNHMNLIETWGYCINGKQKFLVSEFLENGSVTTNLYTLDWEKRYNIAAGTAKGLSYLHDECLEWVLHCDVKPENILLDSNYDPKVADFGLSKLLRREEKGNSSIPNIRGTRGYMAPEWALNNRITSKVDVYSYGIVLLQMITGKSPTTVVYDYIDDGSCRSEQIVLVKWISEKMEAAAKMVHGSPIGDIVDTRMNDVYDFSQMKTLLQVALQCVQEDPNARPTMSQVVDMLVDSNEANESVV